jgi:hypothetical protein
MNRRNWLAVAVLCFVCVPVSMFAQAPLETVDIDNPQTGRRVTFDVVLYNGAPLRMTVREGGIGRIERHSDGLTLGVRPVIIDAERGQVKVEIFGITKREGRGFQQSADSFELRQGELPKRVDVADRFAWNRGIFRPEDRSAAAEPMLREMTVLGIDLPTEQRTLSGGTCTNTPGVSSLETTPGVIPPGPCSRCCVTCDGVTACACAVSMGCGSCCCNPCCN